MSGFAVIRPMTASDAKFVGLPIVIIFAPIGPTVDDGSPREKNNWSILAIR